MIEAPPYCKYGHYEEHDRLPECINEITVYCSVCEQPVLTDPRGDVLDSSGRCDECRP